MLKNYFKIAFRNLLTHKLTSFINIFGLTVGLTCCFAIISYTLNELNYDRHHKLSDRIYRVVLDWKWGEESLNIATTSGPIAPLLKQNFPEVEKTVRFFAEGTEFVRSGTNTVQISPIFTESSFFEIFDHQFLYGNPKTALSQPNSMILTESAAIRIFGGLHQAYGKTLEYINRPPQKVTGIIRDIPANSHLTFNAVGVLDAKAEYVNQMHNFSLYTYTVLKPGTDIPKLEAKIKQMMAKQMNDYKSDYSLDLQPLTSIHLRSHLQGEGSGGNIQYLYIFSIIGIVILLLACINYVNLATAQSARRAKEVGVRKVMGSNRGQLILQFFTESFLLILIASVLSLVLLRVTAPFISQVAGNPLSVFYLGWRSILISIVGMAAVVSLFSGLYPAIFLSKFSAATVLKGTFIANPSRGYFRKSLVILQFTISIALITFTLISWQQLNFVMNKDLGFNKDQVMGLRLQDYKLRTNKLPELRNKLSSYSGILGSAATTNQLGLDGRMSGGGFYFENNGQKSSHTSMSQRLGIDTEYLQLMGLTMKEGRSFSATIKSDSTQAVMVNETLVKSQGWRDPIGKRIWYFIDDKGNTKEAKVIGVVKDFHAVSLHKAIEPLIFFLVPPVESDNLYIKIKPEDIKQTLGFIEKTFREFDSYNPYETYFLDQNFASQYLEDSQKRNLFILFASLAIIIACLGLLGLAAFTVAQRAKEIGIRKVLGASIQNVLILITKDFIWLVIIAFFIAAPIAWWGVNKWLEDFAYRVDVHWWTFSISGILAIVVAICTVSFQAVKAAMANPVKSLRTE